MLDQLLDLGAEQAHRVLLELKDQQLLTTWVLLNGDGQIELIPTPWKDDLEKANYRIFLRRHMRERGTRAYSFLTEAWQASEKPGDFKPEDPQWVPARKRADRIEVVIVMACDRANSKLRSWRIVRNHLEQIIRLDPLEEYATQEGWVTEMLK
jgi:hypothetical protein